MDLTSNRAPGSNPPSAAPWGSSSSSSDGSQAHTPGVGPGRLGGPYGGPPSSGDLSSGEPYGYQPQGPQQQQQPLQNIFGGYPFVYPYQQGGGAPAPPQGVPQGAPCPQAIRMELQQLLSPEDRQTLQQIAARARASALVASFGLGFLAMSTLKKRNWRYPLLGASIIGLTFGPPLGFAGYMLLNYRKVQQMEAKFREAQAIFEQRIRGYPPNVPGGFGGAPYFGGGAAGALGPPGTWRADDSAAAASGWGVQAAPEGTPAAPAPEEILKE